MTIYPDIAAGHGKYRFELFVQKESANSFSPLATTVVVGAGRGGNLQHINSVLCACGHIWFQVNLCIFCSCLRGEFCMLHRGEAEEMVFASYPPSQFLETDKFSRLQQ